jgi:hypothetical protein
MALPVAATLLGGTILGGCAGPAGPPSAHSPARPPQAVLHIDAFTPDGTLARCWTFGEEIPWDAAAIAIGRVGWITTAFATRPRSPEGRPSSLIMATDADSGLVWSATVDGDTGCIEGFTAMAFDRRGGTWIASKEVPAFENAGTRQWILRRFGPRGKLEWSRSACFGSCAGIVTAMQAVGKGDLVVAGIEEKMTVVARFPPASYPVWSWIDDHAHLVSLATDSSGSVYACGVRPADSGEAWEVVKLGADGSLIWTRSYTGRAHLIHPARANAIAVDPAGCVIAGGSETGPSLPPGDDWLLRKYNPDGDLMWERSWNSLDDRLTLANDAIRFVGADAKGDLYVLGDSRAGEAPPVPLLRKYSSTGDVLWTRTAPGTAAFALTLDGNILAAGVTRF